MFIYKTVNLINKKIYVGQCSTNDPDYLGSGALLWKAINKYGIGNFKREILEYCSSREELNEREIYWIKFLNSMDLKRGYNLHVGGRGLSSGPDHPCYGKPLSKSHRLKISKSNMGRKVVFDELARKNMSESHKGVFPSKRTRRLMSLAQKRRVRSKEHCRKISENHGMKKEEYRMNSVVGRILITIKMVIKNDGHFSPQGFDKYRNGRAGVPKYKNIFNYITQQEVMKICQDSQL